MTEEPSAKTARARPCVVALNNSALHHAAAVRKAVATLAEAGVTFFSPTAYSPELNPIALV